MQHTKEGERKNQVDFIDIYYHLSLEYGCLIGGLIPVNFFMDASENLLPLSCPQNIFSAHKYI